MKNYNNFLKTIIPLFLINAFVYFISKLLINDYHVITSLIDNKIPFIIEFILIYDLWYPLEIFSLFLIYKYHNSNFKRTIIAIIISLLTAYLIFFIYPTTVIRPIINSYNNLFEYVAYVTFNADTPVNCFPSCHCILCFISLFSLFRNKNIPFKYSLAVSILNIIIIFSTLYTKQHVVYDVIGAFVITILAYFFISKNFKLSKKL